MHSSIHQEIYESNMNDDDHMIVDLKLVERLQSKEASVEPAPSCKKDESNNAQSNGQIAKPLSTVSNYIEISSAADINMVNKGCKIRISKD